MRWYSGVNCFQKVMTKRNCGKRYSKQYTDCIQRQGNNFLPPPSFFFCYLPEMERTKNNSDGKPGILSTKKQYLGFFPFFFFLCIVDNCPITITSIKNKNAERLLGFPHSLPPKKKAFCILWAKAGIWSFGVAVWETLGRNCILLCL